MQEAAAGDMACERVRAVYTTICLICKREFAIPFSDYRYKDIKYNRGRSHVCDKCTQMIQREAQQITGLNPDLIDEHERVLRLRSR